jgi:hypothetical protein
MIWHWSRPVPKVEDSANKGVSLGEKAMRWLSRSVFAPRHKATANHYSKYCSAHCLSRRQHLKIPQMPLFRMLLGSLLSLVSLLPQLLQFLPLIVCSLGAPGPRMSTPWLGPYWALAPYSLRCGCFLLGWNQKHHLLYLNPLLP